MTSPVRSNEEKPQFAEDAKKLKIHQAPQAEYPRAILSWQYACHGRKAMVESISLPQSYKTNPHIRSGVPSANRL